MVSSREIFLPIDCSLPHWLSNIRQLISQAEQQQSPLLTFLDLVAMADLWALLYMRFLSATFSLFLEFWAATITKLPLACLPAKKRPAVVS